MSEASSLNFEGLLREALTPVEPPEDLVVRLESALQSITELAADELQEWELSAMRDPRNWARPAAAAVAGGVAGAGLVLLRARRRAHARGASAVIASGGGGDRLVGVARDTAERAERALRDLGREARDKLSGGR